MIIVKINFILFVLLIFFSFCDNITDQNDISGITNTDEHGNIIGEFDQDDWLYSNIYFSNTIKIKPNIITFSKNDLGETKNNTIIFENYSSKSKIINFSTINFPFSINRQSINLIPELSDSIIVQFILPDTSTVYKDYLKIYDITKSDSVIITLYGYWRNMNRIIEFNPKRYTFGPAYPNPSIDSVFIPFTLPRSEHVTLKIYNDENKRVATIIDKDLYAGAYRYIWNIGDNYDGIYRAKFETPNFSSHGDIKIGNN